MSEELLLFKYFESEARQEQMERRDCRRHVREECDPFELDDNQFTQRYCLTKQLTRNLCEEIRPFLKEPVKSTDLSVETKVLTALSFYATGSYQRPVGDIAGHSIAQQTVSTALREVTSCLNSSLIRRKYIVFPQSQEQRDATRVQFYNKFGFPGVLGCIDCTHVAIKRPNENEERFFCRKNYYSLNVQLICNADMYIVSVDASYGGATHDAFIGSQHPLKNYMDNLGNTESTWLLGDSGYPLRKSIMTPVLDAVQGSPEAYYTERHLKTRNVIERTIGLLKARFRCLLVHRVLHYEPNVAGLIVNACVILHNICVANNVPVETLGDEETAQEANLQMMHVEHPQGVSSTSQLREGETTRTALIQRLWMMRS